MHPTLPFPAALDALPSRGLIAEYPEIESPLPERAATASKLGALVYRIAQGAAFVGLATLCLAVILLALVPAGVLAILLLLPAFAPAALWCLSILAGEP